MRGRYLNALNSSPLSSSLSFAPVSLLAGIGQEKPGCAGDAGVGKPSACRLNWGSLRLLELQALLIFKSSISSLWQTSQKVVFGGKWKSARTLGKTAM